jgi:hypothetical protein
MAYSTIQKKHCKCSPDCDKWPTMSCFGYWFGHLPEQLAKKAGTRRKVAIKNKNRRTAIAHKVRIAQKEVDGGYAENLTLWFKYQMSVSQKVCENCGASLAHYNEDDWYGSQHHIVEKSLCPSVASHPQNHLILGKWCCHSQWHSCWHNASLMPIFVEAKRKYQLFKDSIAPDELRKVNMYLKLPYIPLNDIDI